ncbi:hypothetical protein P7M26_23730 [Vibrio parahaemolyticus]|uniref:hypothetical protein n=2 Tax=Vibrio parahaemolyticus TaxID=670 RepID=UPI0032968E26|nr:hypothetical protein [Vibrio parahaemolyticus]MDG2784038.1 hypothetical protein [Vibrio parahaemolyticus]
MKNAKRWESLLNALLYAYLYTKKSKSYQPTFQYYFHRLKFENYIRLSFTGISYYPNLGAHMPHNGNTPFEKPPKSGRKYDPNGYADLINMHGNITIGSYASVALFILMIIVFQNALYFMVLSIVLAVSWSIPYSRYNKKLEAHKERIHIAVEREQEKEKYLAEATSKAIVEQSKMMKEIKESKSIGDIIISNNNAPIIISSTITDSFNTLNAKDPDLASAIKTLAGFIEKSGNKEAGRYFDELHQEIAKPNSSPIRLKAYWNGLTTVLPSVEKLTNIVSKITDLFST